MVVGGRRAILSGLSALFGRYLEVAKKEAGTLHSSMRDRFLGVERLDVASLPERRVLPGANQGI